MKARASGLFLLKVATFGIGFKLHEGKVDRRLLEPEAWFNKERLAALQ